MGQNIPIPAETLRRLSQGAKLTASQEARAGRTKNAERIRRAASRARSKAEGKAGEYVSIDYHEVSTLAAFHDNVPREDRSYVEGARTYLEQYGIW